MWSKSEWKVKMSSIVAIRSEAFTMSGLETIRGTGINVREYLPGPRYVRKGRDALKRMTQPAMMIVRKDSHRMFLVGRGDDAPIAINSQLEEHVVSGTSLCAGAVLEVYLTTQGTFEAVDMIVFNGRNVTRESFGARRQLLDNVLARGASNIYISRVYTLHDDLSDLKHDPHFDGLLTKQWGKPFFTKGTEVAMIDHFKSN